MIEYVYPIRENGREILIAHDDKLITCLNATDPVVGFSIPQYIDSHPEGTVMDLLNYCIKNGFECGLLFDSDLVTDQLSQ